MSKILLDSGAYTAYTKGTYVDIDKYIQFLKDHGNLFEAAINLDVIGSPEGSWKNYKYIRDAGLEPMPVYHNGAPDKYLKRYLRYTDYIGFGAIANLDTKQRNMGLRRIWDQYLRNEDGTPKLRVHGLGLTAVRIMNKFPWFSVDSASCVKAASFGKIYLPINPDGDIRNIDLFGVSDQGVHESGKITSVFSASKGLYDKYVDLIERNGFKLGSIQGRKKRPRRCRPDEESKSYPSFNLVPEKEEEDEPNLSNDYKERYKFNLTMWEQIAAHPSNSIEVYHVCSSPQHIRLLKEVCGDPKILVSYLQMSKSMMKEIKKMKGELDEN